MRRDRDCCKTGDAAALKRESKSGFVFTPVLLHLRSVADGQRMTNLYSPDDSGVML